MKKKQVDISKCSDTIFDTELMSKIGLYVNYVNGLPTIMYGIGFF